MSTTTTRYGMHLPASDGSENVNVSTDLIGPLTTVDAELGIPVTTALPSNPASGKTVAVSAAGPVFRSYFHNGTSPASAGWVELLNSSGTFGSDINLNSAKKLVIGSDVNLYRNAANVLKTDDSFVVALNLTVSSSASITGNTAVGGNLAVTGTHTVTGDLKLNGGTTTYRDKLSSQATITNQTTEAVLASFTIPANDAVVGATYRIKAWGTLAVASATTPTITFRSRIGGVAGTTIITPGAVTVRSGATDGLWEAELKIAVQGTGAGGTINASFRIDHNFVTSVTTYTQLGPIISGSANMDTTVSQDLVIDAFWGTANASNTIICKGFIAERPA